MIFLSPVPGQGKSYDVAVIGAGVFGAWAAQHLRRTGRSVLLMDAHGAGNSRASSGGESRAIRMAYGSHEIYTRWAKRSLSLWREFFERARQPELFQRTGMLWTPPLDHPIAQVTRNMLEKCGVPFELLSTSELESRYPQIRFPPDRIGISEPGSGALLARRAVQALVNDAIDNGVDYQPDAALAPAGDQVRTTTGDAVRASIYVYACGPWLPKIFPSLLGGRIRPTRQEVFFFGIPEGDYRFAPPAMPVWVDFTDERGPYTFPDLDSRGFKLAFDRHGEAFDPDTGDRLVAGIEAARAYLAERFPALAQAPLVESRVCQYENTSNGDFLIDRHPEFANVWLLGGGSGHGFKHGPMAGEHITQLIDGHQSMEPRFSLSSKTRQDERAVY